MFAAHQTTGDKTRKTPQKNPQKARKNPQKHAKTRKSWNLVVLGSFRIFLVVPKIITVCVPGRSAEIFPETYMFGTKWIIFWFVWPIFLERPFFPRQWRVEVYICICDVVPPVISWIINPIHKSYRMWQDVISITKHSHWHYKPTWLFRGLHFVCLYWNIHILCMTVELWDPVAGDYPWVFA